MNKTITFVSTAIPYPPDLNGNTENIFHLIKELKEVFSIEIHFVVYGSCINKIEREKFVKYVDKLEYFKPSSKYLFPLYPFLYRSKKVENPVFFCNFDAGYYQSLFNSNTKILFSADSPTFYYSKRHDFKSKIFYWKYIFEESVLFRNFSKIIFVSDLDASYSQKRTKGNGIQIPIGYSKERVQSKTSPEYDLIFSGNFNYNPNREAAEFFLRENLKDLIEIFPRLKICFVGRHPSFIMTQYSKKFPKNIVVTGEVVAVEEHLAKAKIYFSPLQSGSGMKNKILQAMASRLPIVCTRESLSGFSTPLPTGIQVTDSNKHFFEFLVELLNRSENTLLELGNLNQICFEQNYSWNAIIKNYYSPLFFLDEN